MSRVSKDIESKTTLSEVNMVDFILRQFQVGNDHPNSFLGDVLIEEVEWAMILEDIMAKPLIMQFIKPSDDMT